MLTRRSCCALIAFVATAMPALGQTTANIGANFTTNTAATTATIAGSYAVPPDTIGSIGPNYWVSYTNGGEISVWNKAGTNVLDISEKTFWQTKVGLGTGITPDGDPRITFDPLSGRWFAVAFTHPGTTGINNQILIARSDTANPAGTWKGVTINTSDGSFHDFPTLAIDKNGVYIGTNNFSGTSFTSLYSIPKADLLGGTPSVSRLTTFTDASGITGVSLQGVTNNNLGQTTSTNALYLGQVDGTVWRNTALSGTSASGASIVNTNDITLTTAATTPPKAQQPNAAGTGVSTTTLDSSDLREPGSAIRVGNLVYFVHGTTLNSRAALQLEVFDYTAGPTAPVLKAEKVFGETNFDYTYGTVAANANGSIVIGFTRTGFVSSGNAANRWPSATALVGNLSGSTLTFGSTTELQAGKTEYTSFQGTSGYNRWGDYSATQLDPADPGIFWTTQEYAGAVSDGVSGTTNWAVRTTEIIPTMPNEIRWQSATSGNFTDTAQWFNGVVPGAADHAIFSRNGDGSTAFTVTFPGGTTTNLSASVRQGNVIFNIPGGSTYSLTQTGVSTPSLDIAEYLGTANLTVSGGGTLLTVNSHIAAGINSEGPAALVSGGVATVGNASVGSMTVSGSGTLWHNTGDVYLSGSDTAAGGIGSLTVVSGGKTQIDGQLYIWRDNGSTAVVTVGTSAAGNTGTLVVGQLTNASSTAPVISLANSGSLLQVGSSTNSSFSGIISGPGSIEKLGSGSFTLGNVNTYTGGTKLTAGTLILAATNALPSSGTVNFNGGTLSTGASAGFTNSVGALQLSSSSGLTLGTGTHSITFAGITGTPSGTLTITGWNGTLGQANTSPGQVLFTGVGSTPNSTYSTFLNSVQFAGFSGTHATFVLSSGTTYEVVPVPEPGAVLGISFATLWLGTLVIRRVRGKAVKSEPSAAIAS